MITPLRYHTTAGIRLGAAILWLTAACLVSAACPDEEIWGLFPAFDGQESDTPVMRNRTETEGEVVYTMTWPDRGISVKVRLCANAVDARVKVRDFIEGMDGMQPAEMGDLGGVARTALRTHAIACRWHVIVVGSARAATGTEGPDGESLVRAVLAGIDRLSCLAVDGEPGAPPDTGISRPPFVQGSAQSDQPPANQTATPAVSSEPLPPSEPVPGPDRSPDAESQGMPASAPPDTGAAIAAGLVMDLVADPSGAIGFVDLGPYGIRAEVRGAPTRVDAPGGGALMFNGQSDWVLLDAIRELDLRGDTTIEVVARLEESAATGGGYHMMVWRGDERGGHDPYCFSFAAGKLIFRRDLPKTFQIAWPMAGLNPGEFHVFAAVHRSYEQILELWVDGQRVAQGRLAGNFKYDSAGMLTQLGAMDNGRSQFFHGAIARVRLHRRPLDPEELTAGAAALLGR